MILTAKILLMDHILITGASGNLGMAVTGMLLEQGYRVSAMVSKRSNPRFMEHPMLRVIQADLMNERDAEEAVHKAADDGPGISTGMLLVGGFAMGTIQQTSLTDVEKMYRLNFVTAYNVSRPLFKLMEQQEKGGQLIFTGARPALDPGAARQMTGYALSKSLIFRLAEIINEEGTGKGITATVLVPGIIDTPQNRESMPESDFTKWVTPERIAENLLHLLTPAGRELRKTILKIYGDS